MSQMQPEWLFYSIASGGCAALNGAFAKLTTTQLTSSWAAALSRLVGLGERSSGVEYAIRIAFFIMNLSFNGVMWGLFTKALMLATSTVRVSVINTSANFMVTALLGAVVFEEELPALWWLGAGLLVSGSVIIGRREEDAGAATAEKSDISDSASEKKFSRKKDTLSATGASTARSRSNTPTAGAVRRPPRLKG